MQKRRPNGRHPSLTIFFHIYLHHLELTLYPWIARILTDLISFCRKEEEDRRKAEEEAAAAARAAALTEEEQEELANAPPPVLPYSSMFIFSSTNGFR